MTAVYLLHHLKLRLLVHLWFPSRIVRVVLSMTAGLLHQFQAWTDVGRLLKSDVHLIHQGLLIAHLNHLMILLDDHYLLVINLLACSPMHQKGPFGLVLL